MLSSKSYLSLNAKQRIYVDCRLEGMTQMAAAAAAGALKPQAFEESETVRTALIERMQATADEVDFSRKEAHAMYLDAYRNAETATEQIAAVTAMVKLHGLEKPKVIEHKHDHTHTGQLEYMPTSELMKLAEMEDLTLEGEYEEVTEAPQLAAPEVTDDNRVEEPPEVPTVSEDY
jgi:uncharacterized protein with FMN-binding domain